MIKKILLNQTRVWLAPLQGTKAVTAMIFFNVGSRHEKARINGVSHFIEHMFFKGTTDRPSTLEISKELDGVGADFNAFTGKDMTAYYVKAASPHLELGLDLLSDMLHHSLFDPKEVERERGVILEEINMVVDNPMMHIEDVFESTIFPKDPLGRNIAGTKKIIERMSREDLISYREKFYHPKNTVIVVAGRFQPESAYGLVKKYFSFRKNPGNSSSHPTFRVSQQLPRLTIETRETNQIQLAMGFYGLPYGHNDLPAFNVLSTILGGNMSSRLFIQIRERLGLCYFIRSSVSSYSDTGITLIRSGLDSDRLQDAIRAILSEASKFKKELVTEEELAKAKEYLKGKMMLNFEDSENIADFIGMQELFLQRVKTPEDRIKQIQAVTRQEILRLSRKLFLRNRLNCSLLGPIKQSKSDQLIKLLTL